jgi:DNA helicase-2/ATP-dependent DNA helicase PcrA
MLLGDENQAIRPGTATFARIRDILSEHGKAEECSLMTSYRSSPEITDLFTAFLEEKDRVRTTSVQRPGTRPEIRTIKGRDAYLKALKEALQEAREQEGLTCMIAGSRRRLEKLSALLGDDAPPVIRRDMSLPERGPVLMELPLVKGLEFDSVIIPDAVPEEYPADMIGKHRLYTAISRATRRVSIFAEDTMTALLKGRES